MKMQVSVSLEIQQSAEEVFARLADFASWKLWSPWLILESEASYAVSGQAGTVGHSQEWAGQLIGSGRTTLTALDRPRLLHLELEFLKPWKSRAKTSFLLEKSPHGVTVTWTMSSSVPIFLFFVKAQMEAMIRNDFRRGLRMLKSLVEKGQIRSQNQFLGEKSYAHLYYFGFRRSCALEMIGPQISTDFQKLQQQVNSGALTKPDSWIALYPRFDFVRGECEYIAAVGYRAAPDLGQRWNDEQGFMQAHRALVVQHQGDYQHIGNAWSALMTRSRHLKKKSHKSVWPYELYLDPPTDIPDARCLTEIGMPLR